MDIFCIEHGSTHGQYRKYINDDRWKIKLAYLADIFGELNGLNLQIQGKGSNVFSFMNKIEVFIKKIGNWIQRAKENDFTMFSLVSENISRDANLAAHIAPIVDQHLTAMTEAFNHYFPLSKDIRVNNLWIANPFVNANEPHDLTPEENGQLLGECASALCVVISHTNI